MLRHHAVVGTDEAVTIANSPSGRARAATEPILAATTERALPFSQCLVLVAILDRSGIMLPRATTNNGRWGVCDHGIIGLAWLVR